MDTKPPSNPESLQEPRIRSMQASDIEAIKTFTDVQIGQNYFSGEKLYQLFELSLAGGQSCSFVLEDKTGIQGIRLTCRPGKWPQRHPSQNPHPELWQVPLNQAAYFQSLFLSEKYQGRGWGQKLSLAAIEELRSSGARAIICHSWNESPHNSSRKYLDRLGFEAVISIPYYWKEIKYECTRCGYPCLCTATEMVLYL